MPDTITPDLLPAEPEPAVPHATLIARDGRKLEIEAVRGELVLEIQGSRPAVLDRFQAVALRAAILALPGV